MNAFRLQRSWTVAVSLRTLVSGHAVLGSGSDVGLGVAKKIPVNQWPRSSVDEGLVKCYSLEPASYTPILDPLKDLISHHNWFARTGAFSAVEADAMARLLDKRLLSIGVDCALVKRLGAWSKQFWPKYDWTVTCK